MDGIAASSEPGETPELAVSDPEMRQLLGMFDVPAFARRGQELEFALDHLQARLAREREDRLDMVRMRLRQWCAVATSPVDGLEFVNVPALIKAVGASTPPVWASSPGPRRRRMTVARDLLASVERFNRRWTAFLDKMNLGPINAMIDNYNRYYLLEKECAFGSSRAAGRNFRPVRPLTVEGLRADHPRLPSDGSEPTL